MEQKKLIDILHSLLRGHCGRAELHGGLILLFRAADMDNEHNRLCAYRVGMPVGPKELIILRQHLEKLLPQRKIMISSGQTSTDRNGQVRHYNIFSWEAGYDQGSLLIPRATHKDLTHDAPQR